MPVFLFLIGKFLEGLGIISGWIVIGAPTLVVPLLILIIRVRNRALVKKYSLECDTYRLNSSRDMRHLRYVLFLNKLDDRQYTRRDIAKLRRAVEITEIPKPLAIQFNEHPLFWFLFIVPAIGALWTLGTEFVKQTDFWKGKPEAIAALLYVGVMSLALLIEVHFGWLVLRTIIWSRKAEYQEIQRFLQWAERDIEEARALRAAQRLRGLHTRTVQI
jgi:hypothetical protein